MDEVNTTTRFVRPFPWASLDSVTRAEADLLRDVRRSTARAYLGSIEAAAGQILDTNMSLAALGVETFGSRPPFEDGIGVLVATGGSDPPGGLVFVEAERALAVGVVARALRRSAPQFVDPAPASTPALAGAFSAVLVAVARRVDADLRLTVSRVGPPVALTKELARTQRELAAVPLTVRIDNDSFAARVVVSRAACRPRRAVDFSVNALRHMGPTPLCMQVVACTSLATVEDVGGLRPGDAFVPDAWPLSLSERGELRGPAWLASPDGDDGIRVQLAEGGRIVLAGGIGALAAMEDDMDGSNEEGALASAVGDVPVVVRVEIGQARMAARDWAALVRGDVVTLGRRLGEAVVLRIGGVVIARGELVNVDGEVGVRIGERIHGEPPEA